MTVLSRMIERSVAVESPPADAAAVLAAVAEAEAFFLGKQSTGRANGKEQKNEKGNSNTRFLHYRSGITTSVTRRKRQKNGGH